jgi:hypothetical protein
MDNGAGASISVGGGTGGGIGAISSLTASQLELQKRVLENPSLHALPFFLEGGLGVDFRGHNDLTVSGVVPGGQAEAQHVQRGWKVG